MTAARRRRSGFSLIEVLCVVAVLTTLAALIAPNVMGTKRDSRVRAGADTLRGRIADARGQAMEDGRAYRLAVSQDGKRVRVAPDNSGFAAMDDELPYVYEEELPPDVVAELLSGDGQPLEVDEAGWVRVATFLPDGTCREDLAQVRLREPGVYTLVVRVRGLTGASSVEKEGRE
jgi:prepilin-type N-terminal cleavage/methylation domain-containing protein